MLLRPAESDDAMAVARGHVRTWQVAYRTLVPDRYLDGLCPEVQAARYTFASSDPLKPSTILAVEAGAVLGFATTAPSREPDLPGPGELWALYVDPDYWGRGIGAALMSAARARLSGLGFRNAMLWVLAGNVRAERFYRKDGWAPDGARRTDTGAASHSTSSATRWPYPLQLRIRSGDPQIARLKVGARPALTTNAYRNRQIKHSR
jgi:GNAT superfamily N-acetyltransferase